MNKRKHGIGFLFLSVLLVSVSGILFLNEGEAKTEDKVENKTEEKTWSLPELPSKLVDNDELYQTFDDTAVEKIYITALPSGSDEAVGLDELHSQVNLTNDMYYNDSQDPFTHVYLSKEPVQVPINQTPNGTLELRGQSSRIAPQKSYKVKLSDEAEPWNGFKILNLNKHFYEGLRIGNKLSFDYQQQIPDMISYRTKFVELYIRDLSTLNTQEEYQSYGIFTFIEQPNKEFLKEHGLDPQGHFYKAEFFEFHRYEEAIKVKEDPEYSYEAFESILETRGNDDRSKLIEMLEAVNDYSRDINEVVEQYFDEANMLSWLATNILFNNYDTSSRNFMLYSANNSSKWYFISWDCDKGWKTEKKGEDSWEFGLANYWGMALFNRYFRYPENVQKLTNKMEELSEIITPEATQRLIDGYTEQIVDILYSGPDATYMAISKEEYLLQAQALYEMSEKNKQWYYEDLERPMPFYLYDYTQEDTLLRFEWESSFDVQGDEITYDLLISDTPEFEEIIYQETELAYPGIEIPLLPQGEYYWRIVARDSSGHWRYTFDDYIEEGKKYLGVWKFKVE